MNAADYGYAEDRILRVRRALASLGREAAFYRLAEALDRKRILARIAALKTSEVGLGLLALEVLEAHAALSGYVRGEIEQALDREALESTARTFAEALAARRRALAIEEEPTEIPTERIRGGADWIILRADRDRGNTLLVPLADGRMLSASSRERPILPEHAEALAKRFRGFVERGVPIVAEADWTISIAGEKRN